MGEPLTTGKIADLLESRVEGDPDREITGVAALREAGPHDLSFLSNMRYASDAEQTEAAAIIVHEEWSRDSKASVIRVKNPDVAFAAIVKYFAPPDVTPAPGIHETAVIHESARLGDNVSIGPHCVIEADVEIGEGCVLRSGCSLGQGVRLGKDGYVYNGVHIREFCRIGDRVIIHCGSVIGSDGFGYTVDSRGVRTKIPQIGIVEIGDDVEIGANVAIDRARFGKTHIGNGVKIDNLVMIAHNVVVGDHAVIVAQVGISGSTRVGSRAILAGQVGVAGHLEIGEGAIVGAQAGVTKNVDAGTFVSGYPAMPHDRSSRIHAHVMRLPDLKKRVQELEDRLARLEGGKRV